MAIALQLGIEREMGSAISFFATVAPSEALQSGTAGEMMTDAPLALNQPILQMMLLSLLLVYLASKTGGEITNRLGLTAILGSLLGGAAIGISMLGLVVLPGNGVTAENSLLLDFVQLFYPPFTELERTQIFQAQGQILSNLSQLGVILLLFQVGLESNLRELIRVAPQAATAVLAGISVPLLVGLAGLRWLFQVETTGALFAAAAMTAVSIGISASILTELGALKSKEGQLIVGAAVLDDITGILILTVISGLTTEAGVNVVDLVVLVVWAAIFLLGSTVLSRMLGSAFVGLLKPLHVRGGLLLLALSFCFSLGFVADMVGLEALMGAFAAGLILSQTAIRRKLEHELEPLADLLIPIFFVVTGARTDLRVINPFAPGGLGVLMMGAFLALTVLIGRLGGAYLVPCKTPLNRLAIGVGMLPLGEVALVIAGVGVASGRMPANLSAAVVVAILITVSITPGWLRSALSRSKSSDRLAPSDPVPTTKQ
ncbi:MAG: cation:proton antiporter [Cyanobacteria bacterium J06642_2]